jgi:hypothetical protein
MHLAEAYRSLARPSSALEPSHPLVGIHSVCPTELSKRLDCKAYTWLQSTPYTSALSALPKQEPFSLGAYQTWTRWDLNPGPPPRKGGALPAELRAQKRPWRPTDYQVDFTQQIERNSLSALATIRLRPTLKHTYARLCIVVRR